jgi:hypothetical protein
MEFAPFGQDSIPPTAGKAANHDRLNEIFLQGGPDVSRGQFFQKAPPWSLHLVNIFIE